ncbi:MAG: 50S ribosomal protein L29 [Candidatus Liptonbacteria bacterium RIFCSPHIGHO2_01_FULL_57_28]|uniref:Large ribosomal subunit protein uL29 n=1 Tax=Candidatus Liptonbacteria bacterium RIFCSPHIGHO2_01_FULL_57_28 TaxID=1798647 RepID=A0A1G2CD35_9BACT|nr:MAG: 50S ribosomal protein L29 [Candidatus Liptonbacteria bacterium RIFCSPHIGHO2_01_FULL_57_28]
MKKNEREQLKNASVPELQKRVHDAQEKLWTLQRDIELGKQKNVKEARMLRKDIARMLTVINNQP